MTDVRQARFFSEGWSLAADLYAQEHCRDAVGVVLCQGYTAPKAMYFPLIGHALAARGYAVLAFDYKGWGESDGPARAIKPHSRVADVHAAVTFIRSQDEVDATRIALVGFSYGGAVACWAGATDPRVKCVVSVMGVGNGERWLKSIRAPDAWNDLESRLESDRAVRLRTGHSGSISRGALYNLRGADRLLSGQDRGTPSDAAESVTLEDVDDTLRFNPEWIADRIPSPLFLACESDSIVPAAESRYLCEAASEPKELIQFPGIGHYDLYRGKPLDDVVAACADWIGSHA